MFVDDEGDISRTWIGANEAATHIKSHFFDRHAAQKCLVQRAAASLIATRCRRMKFVARRPNAYRPDRDNCAISHEFWERFEINNLRSVENWIAGDFGLSYGDVNTLIFGAEFCFEDVQSIIPQKRPAVAGIGDKPAQPDRGSPLSEADAKRFASAIISGWPDASQDWAHEKALLFFPDRAISRDKFRAIFRAIQGPKNRGKPTKM